MKKIYLLIILVCAAFYTQAQTSIIRFTKLLDSLSVNQTVQPTYTDSVYNVSSTPIVNTLFFDARVNDSLLLNADSINFSAGAPLDTFGSPAAFFFTVPTHIPALVSGPNLIVVWPIRNGNVIGPLDSLKLKVNLTLLGLEEKPLAKMYITQRTGSLNVQFGDDQNIVQQVSLYDLNGQRIFSGSADQSKSIPTGGWSSGIYFCEIKTYKGETRTIKFVLQ
jgi:hypothetical protein